MDSIPTADERAEELVGVEREAPNGAFNIVLRSPRGHTVNLGPYQNRDVARVEAALVRHFVAAVVLEARGVDEGLPNSVPGDVPARTPSSTMVHSAPSSALTSSQIGSV